MMFSYLPKNVVLERNLIHNVDTIGAVLRRLPHLMKALRFSKKTKPFLSQLENELEVSRRAFRQNQKEAIQWMTECLNKLKQSPFADDPFVKPAMKRAEDLLLHRLYNPQEGINFKGYIENSLDALCGAVNAVAVFGHHPIFDGWVEINSGLFCPIHNIPDPQRNSGKVKKVKYSNRWELMDSFGSRQVAIPIFPMETKGNLALTESDKQELRGIFKRAFECWVVVPPHTEIDKDGKPVSPVDDSRVVPRPCAHVLTSPENPLLEGGKGMHTDAEQPGCPPHVRQDGKRYLYAQMVSLRFGFMKGFIYPACIQDLLHKKSNDGQREWLELRDSNPATLYDYLKLIEQYEGYEHITFPPKNKTETWDDLEKLIEQMRVGEYLSLFTSGKTYVHPHTIQELQLIIDQFLGMVAGYEAQKDQIKGGARKSMLSEDAEKYSIREIVSYVKNMSEKERGRFTSKMAWKHMKGMVEGQKVDFGKAITLTMVKERAAPKARYELKQGGINWNPSGGRPSNN